MEHIKSRHDELTNRLKDVDVKMKAHGFGKVMWYKRPIFKKNKNGYDYFVGYELYSHEAHGEIPYARVDLKSWSKYEGDIRMAIARGDKDIDWSCLDKYVDGKGKLVAVDQFEYKPEIQAGFEEEKPLF